MPASIVRGWWLWSFCTETFLQMKSVGELAIENGANFRFHILRDIVSNYTTLSSQPTPGLLLSFHSQAPLHKFNFVYLSNGFILRYSFHFAYWVFCS